MNVGLLVRFAVLLVAEIFFFATLNFFDDWTLQQMPVRFVGAAFASGIAFLAAVSHFPPNIGIRRQAMIFWGVAIILRLIAMPLAPSDDLVRHQWEGKVQLAGFNPYLIAPSDAQLDDLRRDFPASAKINHPELHAFDAPGAELFLKLLSRFTDRSIFYKIVFAIADLGVAAVLLRLIGGDGSLPRRCLVRLESACGLQFRGRCALRQCDDCWVGSGNLRPDENDHRDRFYSSMALGDFCRVSFWNRNLAQCRSRIAIFAFCICPALARDRFVALA